MINQGWFTGSAWGDFLLLVLYGILFVYGLPLVLFKLFPDYFDR